MEKIKYMITKIWGSVAMIIATFLWGFAFSAQCSGMKHIDPILFIALRSLVSVIALIVVIMALDFAKDKKISLWGNAKEVIAKKDLLIGGGYCGIVLAIASVLQQFGTKFTTAGKTGFLTALYIIIVPILGIFLKKKSSFLLWIAVVLALSGAYLLCGGIGSIGKGEWCVIAASFMYSLHILIIDNYAAKCDCVRLSCIQFFIATILTFIGVWIFQEPFTYQGIVNSMPMWVFCGVGSGAIAFTLQMVAQKYLHPVTATLLMSLESVFAVIGGWLFLSEILTPKEAIGCVIIFVAVIISQIPLPNKKAPIENESN